jgi:twitching motility protein PilJ
LLHLSHLPVAKRLQLLGGALVLVMLVIAVVVYRDNRQAGYSAAYIATAGDMRMLSQRLAKASSLALLGDPAAFRQLRESRDSFAGNIERLSNGGELASGWVPPSPGRVQPQLQELAAVWEKTDRNAARLLEMEKNLVSLGKEVASINDRNPQLLDLAEQLAAVKLQGNASTRDIAAANQLVMLTQRIAKNANALLLGDAIDPEVAFLLGKDTNTFRDIGARPRQGQRVAAHCRYDRPRSQGQAGRTRRQLCRLPDGGGWHPRQHAAPDHRQAGRLADLSRQ